MDQASATPARETVLVANEARYITLGPVADNDEADRIGQIIAGLRASDVDTSAPGAAPIPEDQKPLYWAARTRTCMQHGAAFALRERGGDPQASPNTWGAALVLPVGIDGAVISFMAVPPDLEVYDGVEFRKVLRAAADQWATLNGRNLGFYATTLKMVPVTEFVAYGG